MANDYTIRDSGQRSEFTTGAVRDIQTGKGRFDLVPWQTIWALAKHYEAGCAKYGDRNWENGLPISRYFDSDARHLIKFYMGVEDGENHLISHIWNAVCMYETILRIQAGELPAELYDLPKKITIPGLISDVRDSPKVSEKTENEDIRLSFAVANCATCSEDAEDCIEASRCLLDTNPSECPCGESSRENCAACQDLPSWYFDKSTVTQHIEPSLWVEDEDLSYAPPHRKTIQPTTPCPDAPSGCGFCIINPLDCRASNKVVPQWMYPEGVAA